MVHTEVDEVAEVATTQSPYFAKRPLDVVLGLTLSILTLPIVVVLATVSAIKFRCSPFFLQERVGLNGELFRCIKIRSLPKTTPAYLDKVALNGHVEPTGWCHFLRRFHLDELPQFWLVVVGSMSLVGHRPMIASIIAEIPHGTVQMRQSVRPGVTGPWQVSVDGARSLLDSLDYDELYVHNASLSLDLKLLLLTAVQTGGYPKQNRDEVMAMLSPTPFDLYDGANDIVLLRIDADGAEARRAS